MNLENLNLVELNAQEVAEIDGGWGGVLVRVLQGLAIASGLVVACHESSCSKCNGSAGAGNAAAMAGAQVGGVGSYLK
ncbi:hypothetical protein [Flavobacterium sp.]|jgi:hypothetical protein|uniref:hypothetical protein n=1 Tax=Flavobacterium sp. TaxID=239 RepID=UPI0037BF5EF9